MEIRQDRPDPHHIRRSRHILSHTFLRKEDHVNGCIVDGENVWGDTSDPKRARAQLLLGHPYDVLLRVMLVVFVVVVLASESHPRSSYFSPSPILVLAISAQMVLPSEVLHLIRRFLPWVSHQKLLDGIQYEEQSWQDMLQDIESLQVCQHVVRMYI
jgi:hypothetical protein